MNPWITQPGRVLKNVSRIAAFGADRLSRHRLGQAMVRANLKRLHRGWSRLLNKALRGKPLGVRLALPHPLPFWYRPGTTDLLVLEQVFLDGEYDFVRIDPESVEYIVDCGSNIGVTAMLWAQRFPNAKMVLLEPDPENFALLARNTEAFHDRCVLINAAVAAHSGETTLFRSSREYGHSTVATGDCVASQTVAAMTVPDILECANFPRIDLLKMDIEGGEEVVMRTLCTWTETPRFLIAEIHPPYGPERFAAECRSSGLEAFPSAPGCDHLVFAAKAAA